MEYLVLYSWICIIAIIFALAYKPKQIIVSPNNAVAFTRLLLLNKNSAFYKGFVESVEKEGKVTLEQAIQVWQTNDVFVKIIVNQMMKELNVSEAEFIQWLQSDEFVFGK